MAAVRALGSSAMVAQFRASLAQRSFSVASRVVVSSSRQPSWLRLGHQRHQQWQQWQHSNDQQQQSRFFAASRESPVRESPIGWRTLASLAFAGAGVLAYMNFQSDARESAVVAQSNTIGKVTLGGPYKLTNQDGKIISSEDFHGKYVLIYFGFAECPDICPTELRKMFRALQRVDRDLGDPELIQPVFISIDPLRDTPERLKELSQEYPTRPDTQWLTGSMEEITQAAKAFRVYFSIPELEAGDLEDGYLVDHSIFFYLMDRQGDFLEFFGRNETAEEVSAKMFRRIKQDLGAA